MAFTPLVDCTEHAYNLFYRLVEGSMYESHVVVSTNQNDHIDRGIEFHSDACFHLDATALISIVLCLFERNGILPLSRPEFYVTVYQTDMISVPRDDLQQYTTNTSRRQSLFTDWRPGHTGVMTIGAMSRESELCGPDPGLEALQNTSDTLLWLAQDQEACALRAEQRASKFTQLRAEIPKAVRTMNDIQDKHAKWEQQVAQLQARVQQHVQDVASAGQQLENAKFFHETNIGERDDRIKSLLSDKSNLETKQDGLSRSVDTLTLNVAKGEQKLRDSIAAHNMVVKKNKLLSQTANSVYLKIEECEQALRNARKPVSKAGKELGEAHNLLTEHTGDRSVTLRSLDEMFQSMRDSKDYYTNALDEARSSIEILKEEAGARRSHVDELRTNLDVAQSQADEAEIALKNMTGKYRRLQRDSGDKNRQLASANQKQEAKNEDLFGANVRLCGRVDAFESESQEKSEIIGTLVDMVCSYTGNVYTTEQFSQLLAGRQMGKDLIDRFVSFEPGFTLFMEAPIRSTTTSEDQGLSRKRKYDAVETLSAECTDVSEMNESTPSSPSEKLSGDTSDAPRTAVEMGHHQSTSSEASSIGSTILFKPRDSNNEMVDRE